MQTQFIHFCVFPLVFQGEYTGGFPHLLTSSVTHKSPSSSWLCFSYLLLFLISRGFSDDMVVYLLWRQWSPRPNTGPVWQHLQKQKCQRHCGEGGSTERSPDVEGTCYQQIPVSYRDIWLLICSTSDHQDESLCIKTHEMKWCTMIWACVRTHSCCCAFPSNASDLELKIEHFSVVGGCLVLFVW